MCIVSLEENRCEMLPKRTCADCMPYFPRTWVQMRVNHWDRNGMDHADSSYVYAMIGEKKSVAF